MYAETLEKEVISSESKKAARAGPAGSKVAGPFIGKRDLISARFNKHLQSVAGKSSLPNPARPDRGSWAPSWGGAELSYWTLLQSRIASLDIAPRLRSGCWRVSGDPASGNGLPALKQRTRAPSWGRAEFPDWTMFWSPRFRTTEPDGRGGGAVKTTAPIRECQTSTSLWTTTRPCTI